METTSEMDLSPTCHHQHSLVILVQAALLLTSLWVEGIHAQCWITAQFRVGVSICMVNLVMPRWALAIQSLPLLEVLGLAGPLFRSQQELIIHAHFWIMGQFRVGVKTSTANSGLATGSP
jgi:hypothetical protein